MLYFAISMNHFTRFPIGDYYKCLNIMEYITHVIGGSGTTYITERRVVVNSETSKWMQVMSGILQGSVLGPILIYIIGL